MNPTTQKFWKIVTGIRWLYALIFIYIGGRSLLVYMGVLPPSEFPSSPEAKEFTDAIFATGFIGPIMSFTYFASGILMIPNRTAPLGLILLAPFIVVILFTHLMLNGEPPFAIVLTVLWVLFAIQFWDRYTSLWKIPNAQ